MLTVVSRFAAGVALVISTLSSAHALAVSQMFVFGDSLSDSGSAAALTPLNPTIFGPNAVFFPPSNPNLFPPIPVPYAYRFSNGQVAAEYLAGFLGVPSGPAWPQTPSNANPNFAVGGAMTGPGPALPPPLPGSLCCNFSWLVDRPMGLQSGFPAVALTGINNQVTLFDSRNLAFDSVTTLFWIWGGPNDVFLALALAQQLGLDQVQTMELAAGFAANGAANLGARIGELAGLGAKHFLVLNMPNLGATPFANGADLEDELEAVSLGFNVLLDGLLDSLRANGLDIIEFDAFKALNDLIASNAFNTLQPCFDDTDEDTIAQSIPRILAGCPGLLFFDGVHPTTAVHQILAEQLLSAIPEPGALTLLVVGLLALTWARRVKRA
jgi:phospholipase/lecithinase/hemolysin